MRSFGKIIKQCEKLLIGSIVLMMLIAASMVGFGYATVSSDVINSGNNITFERYDGEIVFSGDRVYDPPVRTYHGAYISYDIKLSKYLFPADDLIMDIEGPFCIWIDKGLSYNTRIKLDNGSFQNIANKAEAGYYILDGSTLKKTDIGDIVDQNKWIPTNDSVKLTMKSSGISKNKTPIKIVFKGLQ